MALKDILRFFSKYESPSVPENTDTVSFYHFSARSEAKESFIKEGAKPIGKGVGGQTDGFYCWTKEAGIFSRLFHLKESEGLIVCVHENKKNITYPMWQLDTEGSMNGLFHNFEKYDSFLKENAHHLNINVSEDVKTNLKTITDIQFKRERYAYSHCDYAVFKGLDQAGSKTYQMIPLYHSNLDKEGWDGGINTAGLRQILVDYLCQNNPDFLKQYNQHLLKTLEHQSSHAVKHTADKALPVHSIQKITLSDNLDITRKTIYQAPSADRNRKSFFQKIMGR